jgi:DNA-binding SARP family transcriptional activator/tetratricopeptide (TPR) repeat protein
VEFRLLGPVEIRAAGAPLDVGQPRQRCVLAALAADAGRPVPADTLVDRVWGDDPPERARHALYVYIARIRKLPVPVVRRSGGYVLDVDPDQVDVHRFRRLVERAKDPNADSATLLRQAMALWTGPPLADLPGPWAARVREVWRNAYLDAAGSWAQAELAVGNAAGAAGPLGELVDQYPLNESLAAALMRVLHAAGRTAESLDVYTRTRARLTDELGIDPSGELRDVHQAILRGELATRAATGEIVKSGSTISPVAESVPAQLPADVRGFTGREGALAQLDTAGQAGAVVISALSGTAGVGKTALAVHWAHRVRSRFPDGQLYVNLRGFDPSGSVLSPTEAIHGFLDALEVPPQRIPDGLADKASLYRTVLAGRRVLVVLDNARDEEQIRPLLPGSPGCLVLVTSRNQLPGLVAAQGAQPLTLDLLTTAEARRLLAGRIGAARVDAEPRAVNEIITLCARLPLALTVVAARAALNPRFALAALAAELREARGSLDAFTAGDPATDARTVFSLSYRALSDGAARLFRLLGLHPGPDFAVPAAASLAGVPAREARALLAELTRAHLLTEPSPGRFTFHDLLRAYAAELAGDQEPDAVHRLLDHYLHTADAANRLVEPHGPRLELTEPRPGVAPPDLADHAKALAWYAAELPVLRAAVDHAATTGFDTHAWHLAGALADYLDRQGHWHEWASVQNAALDAARRLADRPGQAYTHRNLARAYARVGRYTDAHIHLRHALELHSELDDLPGQARTHLSFAGVYERQGRNRDALEHSQRGLELFRVAGHRAGQAKALNAVGYRYAQVGEYQQAMEYCEQALVLLEELGDRDGQADTWDSLGYAHHHLGDHERAAASYQRALDLYRHSGDRHGEAEALIHLGETHHAAGDVDATLITWQHALTILDDMDHPDAESVRTRLEDLAAAARAR